MSKKVESEDIASGPPGVAAGQAVGADTPLARPILKPGASGPAVALVQAVLGAKGFASGKVDGEFGKWLELALLGFQQFHKIPATGLVDEETWKVIDSL